MSRVGDVFEVMVGVVTVLLVVFVVGAFAYNSCSIQPRLKSECVDHGGRVLDHHDGRGGWHCEGVDSERAP